MASTQQSAQEFLRNGKTLLTGGHLNCDPLIEALNECKFFINNELHSIESAENSQDRIWILLDIVFSKGESACNTFLKILDKKRFQVFPRNMGYPDLHHWISCFSFQDEPQSQTAKGAGGYQAHVCCILIFKMMMIIFMSRGLDKCIFICTLGYI